MATELKISQSWGIASARHTSGIVPVASTSSYVFDVPLGPSVARWNVKNGEKEYQFQVIMTVGKYSCAYIHFARLGSLRADSVYVAVT